MSNLLQTAPGINPATFFIHIPKTAGSTLRTLIAQNYKIEDTLAFSGFQDAHDWFWAQPQTFPAFSFFHGHEPYGLHKKLERQTRYFTLLREPVARYFSDYFFLRDYQDHPMHEDILHGKISLIDFAHLCKTDVSFDNLMTQYISGQIREPVTQATLNLAKNILSEKIEAFGITARMDESVLHLARIFKWKHPFYLSKNISKENLDDVPEEARKIVSDALCYDRELYSFACDLFETRIGHEGPMFQKALAQYRNILKQIHQNYDRSKNRIYIVTDGVDSELTEINKEWDSQDIKTVLAGLDVTDLGNYLTT